MADRIVTCSEHPDQELAPTAPWGYGQASHAARQCLSPLGHTHHGRRRCAWCGGPILLSRSYQAAYCGGTCRVAAHRAHKRAELARELAGAAGADTGTDTAGMSPAGEAHTGRSS